MNKKYARSVKSITLLHPASCCFRPWRHRLVFAVSAFILFTAKAADIPFWGQANPPTNRTATVSAPYAIPAGTDFRVWSLFFTDPIALWTGKVGFTVLFR